MAYSDCRYCDPPKDKYAWSVKDGYSVIEGQRPPNDCALADTPTDPGSDATDSTTAGGGGTVQESNGAASLVCGVGAAAAAAVLL